MSLAGAALMPRLSAESNNAGKLMIVAAHPDDEYAFAGATYRLARECGWIADQAIVTNGESGYRYATLAEAFYGMPLGPSAEGRANLAEIRKKEAMSAGRVLGIRRHCFLEQRDLGFDADARSADSGNWDRAYLRNFLTDLLARERYDVVFTLLPTPETHGHHRAATLLALDSVARLAGGRPLVFSAEPRGANEPAREFSGLPDKPLTRNAAAGPDLTFDRESPFGYHDSLNYQIVAGWMIAEHKSQGLFQSDYGRHRFEEFWRLEAGGDAAPGVEGGRQAAGRRLSEIQAAFQVSKPQTEARKGTNQ